MIRKTLFAATLAIVSATALAAVSPEEAARLGKDLTPVGAEKAGNKEGTIPNGPAASRRSRPIST